MALRGEYLERPTYTILHTINEGNTAICRLAYHDVFGRNVVQKTVSLLGLEDAAAHQEPRLLDGLSHPNLVEVREAQWDPEFPGIDAVTFTMPYYEGGSIYQALIEDYRFSLSHAVRIACQALDALHYLHVGTNLTHRDIKPGNIFLSLDKQVSYLGDLGSASFLNNEVSSEACPGTPLYLPPEYSEGRYSPSGDIYSLGLVLFELIQGRFRYEEIDPLKVSERNKAGRRALVDKDYVAGPHLSGPLYKVVRKMINPNLRQRYQTALDAQRDLRKAPHLDWQTIGPHFTGRVGDFEWIGSKGHVRKDEKRHYRVIAQQAGKRSPADQFVLRAQWRKRESDNWRGVPTMSRRASINDVDTWRTFFEDVSAMAQRWAAR